MFPRRLLPKKAVATPPEAPVKLVRKPKTGTNSTTWPTLTLPLPSFPSASSPSALPPPSILKTVLSFSLAHLAKLSRRQPFLYTPFVTSSPMLLRSLAFLLSVSAFALAQIVYDSAHNVTPITGTWSSGSMNVTTGAVSIFSRAFCGTYAFLSRRTCNH